MATLATSISGLIEFTTEESRSVIRARCGNDETLQSTLLSLACDDLADFAACVPGGRVADGFAADGWDETQVLADVEQLERELQRIYQRVVSRLR